MRRLLVCLAALGALAGVVSACGGDPTPIFSPTPSASVSTTPTQSASPTEPPAMPEAARQHTKAGAIAFVKYYWAVANYSLDTLDVAPLGGLADPNCTECRGAKDFVDKVRSNNGTMHGGTTTPTDFSAGALLIVGKMWMNVRYSITASPQTITYPNGRKPVHYIGGTRKALMTLRPTARGWRVNMLELST